MAILEGRTIDYPQALDYVWTGLTNYETMAPGGKTPPDFNLGRMERFLARLGGPHRAFRSVHIAGSKGKGSTAAMLASVLHAAGFRVGLYTSPHLHTFRERVRIASPGEAFWGAQALISREEVAALVEELKPQVKEGERLTSFDFITALGFLYFARRGVELAVVEVGLGGRLDSTNVIRPLVSVITNLSLEHTHILGGTLAHIAREKAGIIKEGVPVVSAPQAPEALEVLEGVARERHAPLTLVGRDWEWTRESADLSGQRFTVRSHEDGEVLAGLEIPLLGRHQLDNATLAVAAVKLLLRSGIQVEEEAVRQGLRSVEWPGRLELVSHKPPVLLDGAHNAESILRLREALLEYFPGRRSILIFGAMADKALGEMLAEILPMAEEAIFTRSASPRAASPEGLVEQARPFGVKAGAAANAEEALKMALGRAGAEGLICVAGSLYLVAEAREAWARLQGETPPETDA